MNVVFEFFSSLGLVGWFVIILLALILLNIRSIFRLSSPLDSQDHKNWREKLSDMSISEEPKHLQKKHKRK